MLFRCRIGDVGRAIRPAFALQLVLLPETSLRFAGGQAS
jgi:hypothetical protein